jgi:repressor LexA
MYDLTARQKEVYQFLKNHFEAQQRMPTFREICTRFELAATNAVQCHVNELIRKGYLECVLANNAAARYTGHNRLKFVRVRLKLEPLGNGI